MERDNLRRYSKIDGTGVKPMISVIDQRLKSSDELLRQYKATVKGWRNVI
jgi:hypothetical protein